jgi:hypothetical protein
MFIGQKLEFIGVESFFIEFSSCGKSQSPIFESLNKKLVGPYFNLTNKDVVVVEPPRCSRN